jgi:hypothetical protein
MAVVSQRRMSVKNPRNKIRNVAPGAGVGTPVAGRREAEWWRG